MAICVSIGGPNLYKESQPSNEILVGTINGVVHLTRSAASAPWREEGRTLEGKHVSALLIEPTRGTLFAGTHGDGIYASTDQGRSWTRKDQGVGFSNIFTMNFVEGPDGLRLYAGTEPAHLYVSTDIGESWAELPALRSAPSLSQWTFPAPPHEAHVKVLAFDPRSPDTIYVGIEVGTLLKSEDRGQTFRELSGFEPDIHRVMLSPVQPDRVLMTNGGGVYRSGDAGTTWEHLTDRTARIAYPDGLVVDPERPEIVVVSGAASSPGSAWLKAGTADPRIARSRDAGTTWELLERGLPEHIHGNIEALTMDRTPTGFALVAGTTDGDVFYSDDEGETWSKIAEGIGAVSKAGHYRGLMAAGRGAA